MVKKIKKNNFIFCIVISLFLNVITSCTSEEKKEKKEVENKEHKKDDSEKEDDKHEEKKDDHEDDEEKKIESLIKVETITPKIESSNIFIETQGKVYSKKNVSITSLADGKIKKVYFSIGDNIKKGETIAILDNQEANNEEGGLKSKLAINNNIISNFETKLKSYQEMFKIGIVAKNDLDNIINEINTKKLENEDINLNINKISTRKTNYTIKSNFNGYVSEIVSEGSFLNYGQNVASLISEKDEYIESLIPSEQIKNLSTNQKVEILSDTSEKAISGSIYNVSPIASFNMIKVIIKPSETLPLNLDVKIKIPTKSISGLSIPKSAIVLIDGKTSVFAVKDGKSVAKAVDIQKDFENKVIISKGITNKDNIVIKNADILADGTKVLTK
ncbi:MAG: efflux RND transporter periplasmic adaptor subunit [Cyanobacteriota bacterium]